MRADDLHPDEIACKLEIHMEDDSILTVTGLSDQHVGKPDDVDDPIRFVFELYDGPTGENRQLFTLNTSGAHMLRAFLK